jgi:hypothetical protein
VRVLPHYECVWEIATIRGRREYRERVEEELLKGEEKSN